MNLVMIGHFESPEDAKYIKRIIDKLSRELDGLIDIGAKPGGFGEEVLSVLQKVNCHILAPWELEQFLYEFDTKIDGNKIYLKTDEFDVSAFFKIMINKGAKIEIFSVHDYPNEEYGRGK